MSDSIHEWPRYRCHKEVRALKIGADLPKHHEDGSVTLPIAVGGYFPVTVPAGVVSRYFPKPGDYLVVYDDGYQSISPAKAFEDGYARL